MTPQELKNSILQLAIQGKLVDQREEEGTAEGFYQQIQLEKQKLIKAGIIKKDKPLPEITEDEKPFDIPESWLWVHLDNIAISALGKTLDKAKNKGDFQPYLCSINVYWSGIDLGKVKEARFEQDELLKYKLEKGDLLICEGGDVGRSAVWDSVETMYYQNALHRVRFYGGIDAYFYKYLLECYKGMGIINAYSKGMTIKHLVQSALNDMWLPLAPLAEQKRIVAKIEELLPNIDRYEKAWSKLEDFNKRFPIDMQKSILQIAIQGKLVEQRSEEGTGEDLYQQIQAEKQRLIKAGAIKTEKPLPEITEDEKPFDIPDSWKWIRLGEAINLLSGTDFKPEEYNDVQKGVPYITGASSLSAYGVLVNRWTETPRVIANLGDVLLVCKGSGYGKTVICDIEGAHIARQIMAIKHSENLSMQFIKYFLNANQSIIKSNGQGVIPGIDRGSVLNMRFPLPPVAEQKRIVAKLEEILPLCEKLK